MHHADSGFIILVLQIGIEQAQVVHKEHALVHDGAAGQAGHISAVAGLLEHAAHNVQLAVKIDALAHLGGLFDEALPDSRHTVAGFLAHGIRVHGNLAPCQKFEAFLAGDHLEQLHGLRTHVLALGEEEHADTVFTCLAKLNAKRLCYLLEEFVGNLKHDADTISGLSFRVLAGAVFQVFYNMKCLLHGTVARDTLDIGYSTDTTVVMLKARIIKARSLCCRSRVFWGVG